MAKSVTVIGAGIVGVCCALHLQREGFKVRLVDKGEPGMKASFGNSGSFGTASCVPFAMPGVLKKVPKMLFDSTSPLKLRWSHVPSALPWFLRSIANSRRSRVEEISRPDASAAVNGWLAMPHSFDYNVDHLGLGTIDSPPRARVLVPVLQVRWWCARSRSFSPRFHSS